MSDINPSIVVLQHMVGLRKQAGLFSRAAKSPAQVAETAAKGKLPGLTPRAKKGIAATAAGGATLAALTDQGQEMLGNAGDWAGTQLGKLTAGKPASTLVSQGADWASKNQGKLAAGTALSGVALLAALATLSASNRG